MIQLLAAKYNKHIAYVLLLLFISSLAPVYSRTSEARLPAVRAGIFNTGIQPATEVTNG
ncbi:hypothetical protein [Paraflavitalea speifideaquila]|uniref:hypothetical protein n=1 Tax=Paraflavitalea speifideaquila TaxID=3076558 RepID=UPI0028F0FF8D|nr:hypothetical protein [Paraflavitalea speifideiaquila]